MIRQTRLIGGLAPALSKGLAGVLVFAACAAAAPGNVLIVADEILYTLKEAGNPTFDPELEASWTAEEIKVGRGGAAVVTLRVRNQGSSPISGLRISFHPRLDLAAAAKEPPRTIPPGGEAELVYEVRAPEMINLTCESNRVAYAHWSAVYQREGRAHGASLVEGRDWRISSPCGAFTPAGT